MERDAGVLATERLSPERGHGAQQHVRACAGGQLLKHVSVLPGRRLDAYVTYFCFCVFFVGFFYHRGFYALSQKTVGKQSSTSAMIDTTVAATRAKSLRGRNHPVTSQGAVFHFLKSGVSQRSIKDGEFIEITGKVNDQGQGLYWRICMGQRAELQSNKRDKAKNTCCFDDGCTYTIVYIFAG